MDRVYQLGQGDIAVGAVRAFESGVLDVPFAPSDSNSGVLMPVRDNHGAVRVLDFGATPCSNDVANYHREMLSERAAFESRDVSFQMVIDDVNAISRGRLIGRPS
jgi:methylaspartate mutase epsilon subunit